jgi:hypothetical protein
MSLARRINHFVSNLKYHTPSSIGGAQIEKSGFVAQNRSEENISAMEQSFENIQRTVHRR